MPDWILPGSTGSSPAGSTVTAAAHGLLSYIFTIPLELPMATHRSPPSCGLPDFPPRLTAVVPTAPSSIQRAIMRFLRPSHSLTSPLLPTTHIPSPSLHQAKSATPPRLSMRTCAIHCSVVASSIVMMPPPFLVVPTMPIHRPHGESLNRSIDFCSSRRSAVPFTFSTFPVSRSQMWKNRRRPEKNMRLPVGEANALVCIGV
jgi:hypothetical protein